MLPASIEEFETMDTESVGSQSSVEPMDISYEDIVGTDTFLHDDEGKPEDAVSTKSLRKNLVLNFDNAYDNYDSSQESKFMMNKSKKKLVKKTMQKTVGNISRPPKVPVMHIQTTMKRSHEVVKHDEVNEDQKPLMSVYLRLRPPVAPDSKELNTQVNTIEMIPASEKNSEVTSIRTYPPLSSNAAKSYRSGSKRNLGAQNTKNNHSNDIANGICDTSTSNRLAAGVKEFEFNQVFKPDSTQRDIYDCIAKPLVEGLFPTHVDKEEEQDDDPDKLDWKSPLKKRAKASDGSVLVSPRSTLVGKSALLFAYGITNAGKTHTIIGDTFNKKGRKDSDTGSLRPGAGILPRALEHMLTKIERATEADSKNIYLMHMSYLEIYNENVFDLLASEKRQQQNGYDSSSSIASSSRVTRSKTIANASLRLREDTNGNIFVKGLSKHPISSVAQGIRLANVANDKRHTSSNNINKDSSRSHCVCQLELTIIPKNDSIDGNDSSTASFYSTNMWIVDLAGIERSKRTGMMYRSVRQKEASSINASLMNLMRCLQTMSNNQKNIISSANEVIPFRESKLTHLFMNHLTGASASQTSMIINVNPAAVDYDETQHVLSYGAVARTVKISTQDYLEKFRIVAGLSESNDVPKRISDENDKHYKNGGAKSPRQKVAKIVNRLSPRALMKKKREKRAADRAARAKTNAKQSSRKGTSNGVEKHGEVKSKKSKNSDEAGVLRATIKKLQEENTSLRTKSLASKEDQIRRDSEMRMEVVQEMENEIREIRDHYESLAKKNKVVSNPTPMKTIKTLQTERQEQFIQELMEKNDECEDEMTRMSERHRLEMNKVEQLHKERLKSKDEEIVKLQNLFHSATKDDKEKIKCLQGELSKCKRNYDHIKKEHENLIAYVENESIDAVGNDMVNDLVQDDKENMTNTEIGKSSYRRLPRNRHSEVACADVPIGKRVLRSQNAR